MSAKTISYFLYKIIFINDENSYLGISRRPDARKNQHFMNLRNETHTCSKLQKQFHLHDEKEISFLKIARFPDKKSAYHCEQFLLKYANCFYNEPNGLSSARPRPCRLLTVDDLKKKKFLNATEAAKFFGLPHRQQFYRLKSAHKLAGVDYGGRILYALADLKRIKKEMGK